MQATSSYALRLRQTLRGLIPPRIYAALRLLRERSMQATFRPRVVKHRFGSRELLVSITDATAAIWYDRDWPVPSEITLLSEQGQLRAGATVFELGAHQGVVAMMLADRVGSEGRVIALEATKRNAELATRNVAMNSMANITIVHAAAAERPGTISFEPSGNGHVAAGGMATVTVRAMSVDELARLYGPPRVLFIDVEGYELNVLRGAGTTLGVHRPDLFVEVHTGVGLDDWGTAADVLAQIPSDYSVFVAQHDNTPFKPLAEAREYLNAHSLLVAIAPRRP